MEWSTVERDYVSNTLEILQQYKKHIQSNLPEDNHYEVSLLLNSLLGLIVFPYEYSKREQSIDLPQLFEGDEQVISMLDKKWGLTEISVSKFKLKECSLQLGDITIRELVYMLRHSLAHNQFHDGYKKQEKNGLSAKFKGKGKSSEITSIKFVNKYRNNDFVATISVKDLRKFAEMVANSFLGNN